MNELGDLLARMTIRVTSPDGRVRIEQRGRGVARMSFASPDDYAAYRTPDALAGQVSAALNSAGAGAERGRRMLIEKHTRLTVPDGEPADAKLRRYRDAEAVLAVVGHSRGRTVRVRHTGGKSWDVTIVPGAMSRLTAGRFCAEVNAAIVDAAGRYATERYKLRRAEFGTVGQRE